MEKIEYLVIFMREARYPVTADDEAAALRQALLQERLEDYQITGHRIELAPRGRGKEGVR